MSNTNNFKVRCTGYNGKEKFFTLGKIYDVCNGIIVSDDGFPYDDWAFQTLGRESTFECLVQWMKPYYDFELVPDKDKIVITTDGKTTTATKYYSDGKKVKATARCAPEDTFDFNVGAELAMERLMNKINTENVVAYGFKVGDRVNYKGVNGTVICILANYHFDRQCIGVEFDSKIKKITHNCEGFELAAGKVGTSGNCRWFYPHEINKGEIVKPVEFGGFKVGDRVNVNRNNGTVICISVNEDGSYRNIGVEFDNRYNIGHDCQGFKLADGAIGTKGTSRWFNPSELTRGEVPQYYNGKVVCVENKFDGSRPVSKFTIGKVYEINDGVITSDEGYNSSKYVSVHRLCAGMGHKFIEIVE